MTLTRIFQMAAPLGAKAALGGLLLALGGISIADAQYYSPHAPGTPGGLYEAAPPRYRPQPPPDYYRPPPPRRDYYRPPPPPEYYGYTRRRAYGSICVTARGSCSLGRPVAMPSGCVCNIPGFGKKRGSVQ